METATVDTKPFVRTLPKDYESNLKDLSAFFTKEDNFELFYFGNNSEDHDEYPHIDLIDANDGKTVLATKRIGYSALDKLAHLQGVIKEVEGDDKSDQAYFTYDITEVRGKVKKGQFLNP